jgi:RNA 2',3'-cyclic 3'-phosphodiesterase
MTWGQVPGRAQGETLRLFVAIELPEPWLEALAGAQRALAEALETPQTPRLRWVHPAGIHLTLKFLGNLPTMYLAQLHGLLSDAVPAPPRLVLSLGEPGFFMGSLPLVRVIWAGVRGDIQGLETLASNVDKACSDLGVPRERRGFAPHLTLARVPDETSIGAQDMRDALSRIETLKAPPLTVTHVSLMRSHLGPGGARYERIAAFPPQP